MYLILCGSSISFMEEEVLSEKSPLFGRRTAQLQVKPFSYREAADFVPSYTPAEKAVCYGITGGVAKYLSLLRDTKSLDENIVSLFFAKTGYMYEEPSNLLTQEFRNITTYNAIIEAIASGRTKQNAIADLTHLEPSTTSHAIQNLIKTGILKKNMLLLMNGISAKSAILLPITCSASGTAFCQMALMPLNSVTATHIINMS